MSNMFPKTQLFYRDYVIQKRIIFYIVEEVNRKIHVLRVLREERNWMGILEKMKKYTYPE